MSGGHFEGKPRRPVAQVARGAVRTPMTRKCQRGDAGITVGNVGIGTVGYADNAVGVSVLLMPFLYSLPT